MRRLNLSDVTEGMFLGKTLYSEDGRVLLKAGTKLKARYIERLDELGVITVYVMESEDDALDMPDVLSESTRVQAMKTVKSVTDSLRTDADVDSDAVHNVVSTMIDEIISNKEILVGLSDIRTVDSYTFGHCVNVCVLCILAGLSLGFDHAKLKDMGVGALLHDVGKIMIPKEILTKAGKLSKEEFEIVKEHPHKGFQVVRKITGVNILSAHVAYQHHERLDGTGYPRGLREDEIHEFGLVAAVADVFDALTADRVYRQALMPSRAAAILRSYSVTQFSSLMVEKLLENIALYPVGSIVELNTGEVCQVVKVRRSSTDRPVVRILTDADGVALTTCEELDLSKCCGRIIVDVRN
jgi:HD-GYP domain-containing protein (c-di-GMP phosphodiesterase class II)